MGFIIFCLVIILILSGFALPPALRTRSWKRFFGAAILSALGVLFPVLIFLVSAILVPDYKGGCVWGWVDCFHGGKLALTPFVIWACAAFYVCQILRPAAKPPLWVILGLFIGSVTSAVCFLFGLLVHGVQDIISWWLLVPLYVAVWHSTLSNRAMKMANVGIKPYVFTLLGSLPFWAISLIWSRSHYASLPENRSGCFVVTAAMGGHKVVVGPLSEIKWEGSIRLANQQIKTFWKFESVWISRSPVTHKMFRRFYNKVGPLVARHVKYQFAADIVYLMLKPFELAAALIVYLSGKT